MILVMALVMALLLSPEPALLTRQAFPDSWVAGVQVERCHRHVAQPGDMRSHRGYEDGRWDAWVAQTQSYAALWGILAAAESDLNEATMRVRLEAYRKLAGDGRYLKRWTPPLFPEETSEPAPWHQPVGWANPQD